MDHDRLHARARQRGVNPLVYRLSRVVLEPAFLAYFGLRRAGRGHLPPAGPVILASNHRSFLDPFVIGTAASRPIYYVAKEELFRFPPAGWWLNALGAFPVRRGAGDADTLETARAILARGDVVLLFCEGTRVRPGPLGRPRRGVGRLALESGAPVVPVAVLGTEAVRDGWRIRPHRVRVRLGPAVRFPRVADADRALSTAVTEHVWARVRLQWEWLGGEPPLRRAAVLGGGRAAAAAAARLGRSGLEVELDPAPSRLARHDLVVFAAEPGALRALVATHGPAVPGRAGVLVPDGVTVPPLGTDAVTHVAEHTRAGAVGTGSGWPAGLPGSTPPTLVGVRDPGFARRLAAALPAHEVRVELLDQASTSTGRVRGGGSVAAPAGG